MANQNNAGDTISGGIQPEEQEKPMFHDFLGTKTTALDSKKTSEPISATSALGSERRVGNHLDGVQLCGPRNEIPKSNINNGLSGRKRSNSDSVFTSHESPESLHRAKISRNGPRLDHMVQYPSCGGEFGSFAHQFSSRTFKDANPSTSLVSQMAADEGSRTGIQGPGILGAVLASTAIAWQNSSSKIPGGRRLGSSTPPSRQVLASGSQQMTIFYGGRAHVFDDVHPNKADVIMALAGSNGGSWSTIFSPKPTAKSTAGHGTTGSSGRILTSSGHP